jgi:sec-independent protein translocase protein TatA
MIGLGMQELIIIFVIVMILFGAKRLPEIGKGIGQAIRDFNGATSGKEEVEHAARKSGEEGKQNV